MIPDFGRPRDPRIDSAVLRATVELLGETGYAGLLVYAIARRAGTSKPAIYRRWPSKAHLVHEAVFPIGDATEIPDTGSLPERSARDVVPHDDFADHPGRQGGTARTGRRDGRGPDPALGAPRAVQPTSWRAAWPSGSSDAAARGEVRPDVTAAELAEAIAGITLLALLTRGDANSTTPGSTAPPRASLKGISA